MVEWICHKCKYYNNKMSFPGRKIACNQCGQERDAPLPKQQAPTPTPQEIEAYLRSEVNKAPPLPPQHEEPPLPPAPEPIDLMDPRCKLGAHVCRYCNQGFLQHEQQELPEELGGKKRR